ncbi:MAG: hypothetical protein HC895_02765 [Leptolyngbyaceae cyanobacterium SM1_3_5]|nr:hypothetical protein [Leptolyngbyaceae cyanobacterium SM1_3_5]
MTHSSFPYPSPNPLERLHVHDGLMMNAERWQIAHRYHRHRQNVHYQALYQPGIVCGLGVKVISPPATSSFRYRAADQQQGESRWLEIQPGIAIDIEGNPIIVDAKTDRTYRIAIDPPSSGNRTVYLVVSYVDPDALNHQPHKLTVAELFRLDQKTQPPNEREVELCRIELTAGGVFLKMPQDVLAPDVNEINLLHRVQAQARAQTYVRLGAIAPRSDLNAGENCDYLIRSLAALYPVFQGEVARSVSLTDRQQCNACDLLFTSAETLINLNRAEIIKTLRHYFNTGGLLLVESANSDLDEPVRELLSALRSQQSPQQASSSGVSFPWSDLATGAALPPQHPLRTEPFVFTVPPTLGDSTQIFVDESVVWVRGKLSEAWGIHGTSPRSEIRTAQELGINVLRFAWQRRHLTALMRWTD